MLSFLVLTTVGTFIWNAVLVYLGKLAGASWGSIVAFMDTYSSITVYTFVILAVILAIIFYSRRISKKAER
jgi:membrane protein DedA with SNARE-associated domain